MKMDESKIQEAVVNYIRWNLQGVLYTASAGGMRTSMSQARKMKRMGYTAGTPDLCILEPKGGYHGLFIELKTPKGRPDPDGNQDRFIAGLKCRGYAACFCYGHQEAIAVIDHYMKGGLVK
jgi:hypothetical protein